ncbi:protein FAM186A [Pteronotus mesoamericanus]|uniref:protein FAM186A n=1 Tax=Pteronotus mesoamericanus TaxID=1884717 RepID=UPI0023EBE986|nr:protein FAM186A [Pteronotus parnellii mesoamericanus]
MLPGEETTRGAHNFCTTFSSSSTLSYFSQSRGKKRRNKITQLFTILIKMKNKVDNEHESENEVANDTILSRKDLGISEVSRLEIPFSVQQVISEIEQAQISRAKQDINMQLVDIMQRVQQTIRRYAADENVTSGRKISLEEHKKWRINLLEKIAAYTNSAEIKEMTLIHILAWLKEWNATLSEMTAFDIDEHHRWIVQMELLSEMFKAFESNVKMLNRTSTSLLKEKKQKKKITSRGTLWKAWKERVIKRPATAHALRPDQMISDEFAANTKVSEIQGMLQELIDNAIFNKLENNAIKYISSTIVNLSIALSSLKDEVKVINLQNANMYINETSEKEKEVSLKIIQDLSEENEMLQQKLQDAELKCEYLIQSKVSTVSLTSNLKALAELSPQSSVVISKDDKEERMDSILAKEFENSVNEALRKGTKDSGIKWDSGISYTAQVEMIPDLIEQQSPLPEKKQKTPSKDITEDKISLKEGDVSQKGGTDQYQSQKSKSTKGPYVQEISGPNLSDDKGKQIVSETKADYHFELPELEKNKEVKFLSEAKSKSFTESKIRHVPADFPSIDTKGQGSKSVPTVWERLKEMKIEHILEKSQISSENQEKPTTESMDKESKSDMSSQARPYGLIQLDNSSEKVKTKRKKRQISAGATTSKEGKTEVDMSVFSKKLKSHEFVKSKSRITEEASESTKVPGIPDSESEPSNLEEFHKAIMAFLKEKIDNTGKPVDKKTVPEEELILKETEVEKLGIIKAKMEEYFQNAAETVTKILRKYKDIKNVGEVGEKPMKQKTVVSLMPGLHSQEPISAKSDISSLLSSVSMDPVIHNVIQMILTEIEGERDAPVASIAGRDHKEKEKQRQEEYLQEVQEKSFDMNPKDKLQEERNLWKASYEMISKNLEQEKSWLQMEGKQEQQKENQWPEEVWKKQQKQRMQKQIEQDEKQKQMEEEKEQKQQLVAGRQKMKEQGVLLEKKQGQQVGQVQKEVKHLKQESSWEKEEEKQKPMRKVEDHQSQWQKKAKEQMKGKAELSEELGKMLSYTSMTLSPRWKKMWKGESRLHKRQEFLVNLNTLETLADEEHSMPIVPSTSTQSSLSGPFSISGESPTKSTADITFTPEQAQALGVTLTPQQVQALGVTLTPEQAQVLGVTLTPEQAQALGVTLTPEQAQALGVTVTPQQAQALGVTLTPQQAQALGVTLTPQQAQALGVTLTPEQAQALGVTLTPQQAQALGVTLTPQQAQALGVTLTPQQAQALGVTLSPQQVQALGVTLTPDQAQALGVTLTPEQAQALGVTLTPEQAQALGVSLAPQQAQALGVTVTPQQAQALGVTLTPQQAQALGVTLTPEQAQALGVTFTPEQAQVLGVSLTPQQAQALGVMVTPPQAQALGVTVTPQQAPTLGVILTPQQAQAFGVNVTPEQAQALGVSLTPQQAQVLGVTVTPQQAQALGVSLTPQQAQALGVSLTPQQAQALGVTPTPQQAQALGVTPTPQQAQALGVTVTPQQAQVLGVTLTPEQAQALGVTLTPEQAQALGVTLTPEQAQALGVTLTPEQAQALGVTLTPQQAQAPGVTVTPQQAQALGVTVTPQQAQALGVTVTSQQAQELGVTVTPQQAQAMVTVTPLQAQELGGTVTPPQAQGPGVSFTPDQAQAQGITLTPQQPQALGVTVTPKQAQALGATVAPEQAQALGVPIISQNAWVSAVTLSPEQAESLGPPLTSDKAHVLGYCLTPEQVQLLGPPFTPGQAQPIGITHIPFQESKTSLPSRQSITSRTRQSLASSAPIAEKSSIFEVSSTPLQISSSPLTQALFVSGKSLGKGIPSDPGKLLAPQAFPSSRQTLVPKGQSTSVQFLAPEVSPTVGKLPISGAPPTLGQPLISGVPPTSSQIPSLWAPLSPQSSLVPGASPIPGELKESGPLTLSEQCQAFHLPATCEQSPCLQAPSVLGQHLAPWTLPRQASPLWISPTPGHRPTLWAPSIPGKPQKDLSSFVSKKSQERLAIISSLKSKSALVRPSAPNFKVPQAPFTTKKFQMSEVSDTPEEIQRLRDPFAMEQFMTFQPYLTNYRTPVSQTPYINEGALPTHMEPITSLPSLTTQLPKTSQISHSEWDWKSRFPPISKPCIMTPVSGTKKPKMMAPPSSPQELKEQRYFVDVEAQRKNLILLNQPTKTSGLLSELHTTARNLVIETLHTDTVRLGYLFRKYIAYRLIQHARNNIIKQLQAIQNSGKGYESQYLYIILSRIDNYQKKVMGSWTEKQKSLEQKRNQCLRKMMSLFCQLQEMHKLNLSQPVPLIIDRKQIPAPTKSLQQPFLELLTEKDRKSDIFKKLRYVEDQMEAIWNADQSTSSYPITEKTSIHSLWAQLGGYPAIPMLLQLDVQSTFRKSLQSIQSNLIYSIQKDLNDLVFEKLEEYLNKAIYMPNLFNGAFSSKHRYTTELLQVPFQTTRAQQRSTKPKADKICGFPTLARQAHWIERWPENQKIRGFLREQHRDLDTPSGKAAPPPKGPSLFGWAQHQQPGRNGAEQATRTLAPRPQGRRSGVRAPAAVGGVQGGALSWTGAGPQEL